MVQQAGFFDVDERLKRLSDLGDQFEACVAAVDVEIFRADPDTAPAYADGRKGTRPPHDPVLMFRILIIQAQNTLSDDRAEFLISDRLSFMRFPGTGLQDKVPDAKTIRAFPERLTRARAIDALFARFETVLRDAGYIAQAISPCQGNWWTAGWLPPQATQCGRGKERHRCALDRPVRQGEDDRGRRSRASLHHNSVFRGQEPRRHRQSVPLHPPLGCHGCRPP